MLYNSFEIGSELIIIGRYPGKYLYEGNSAIPPCHLSSDAHPVFFG